MVPNAERVRRSQVNRLTLRYRALVPGTHADFQMAAQQPGASPVRPVHRDYRDRFETLTGASLRECPVCRQGRMQSIGTLLPIPPAFDTS